MIIVIPLDEFDEKCVYFSDVIKNIVINDSIFIRIYYSTDLFTMNGLFLSFPLILSNIEKTYSKTKCYFNTFNNMHVIDKIKSIEHNILEKLEIKDKTPVYKITNQLLEENIKLYNFDNSIRKYNYNFVCKISGLWDDGDHYGLTYKFII
jgi:hypothetical protein